MTSANFSSLRPRNLLTSIGELQRKRRSSRMAVTRPCRRIVAGFLLPSIHRRRASGHRNARGWLVAACSSRHPRPQSLRSAGIDANKEAEMAGAAGTGVRKRQACREVRP